MDEDLKHALIHCPHAWGFWEEAYAWFDLRLPNLHQSSWARDVTCDPRFTDDERTKITTIMWSIWHSRDRVKHVEDARDPVSTMRASREAIALLNLPRDAAAILPGFGWRPPDEGFVKINTDGALNFVEARGGAGGVARSSTSLLGSWCKPYLGVSDPLITEAFALRDGVHFAALRGWCPWKWIA
ncbi:alanyl-trna synthetase [Hordeum vulgare]|nr:alanyl-trna synthetase [Hordeum vulgare]